MPSAALAAAGGVLAAVALWRVRSTPRTAREEHAREAADGAGETGAPAQSERATDPSAEERSASDDDDLATRAAPVARIPRSLMPVPVLQALLASVGEIAPARAAHLWLADAASGTLRQVAVVGERAVDERPIRMDADDLLVAALGRGVAECAPLGFAGHGERAAILWRLTIPVDGGNVTGVAAVDIEGRDAPDLSWLPELTARLHHALSAALSIHAFEAERAMQHVAASAAVALARCTNADDVRRAGLRWAMNVTGAHLGVVLAAERGGSRISLATADGEASAGALERTYIEAMAASVVASGRSQLREGLPSGVGERAASVSVAAVPLAYGNHTLGVLGVGTRYFPAVDMGAYLGVLESIARQTAAALRAVEVAEASRSALTASLRVLAGERERRAPDAALSTDLLLHYTQRLGERIGLDAEDLRLLEISALVHELGSAESGAAATSRSMTTVERALLRAERDEGAAVGGSERAERILAVAVAYVSLTVGSSPQRLTPEEALEVLQEETETRLDPAVTDLLCEIVTNERTGSSEAER